jgi:quinol monooxygenase YgiN
MMVVLVKARILPGKQEKLRSVANSLQRSTVTEDGCQRYEPFVDGDTFIIIERWASREDLDKHMQQDHMKVHLPQLRECVAGGVFEAEFVETDSIKTIAF